jgi:glucose-1-phosphate adenylyltransferase
MIGSDYFETEADRAENRRLGRPDFNIGDGSVVQRAILDKDCRLGKNLRLVNKDKKAEYDDPKDRFHIREGIICVPRGVVLPDGFEV